MIDALGGGRRAIDSQEAEPQSGSDKISGVPHRRHGVIIGTRNAIPTRDAYNALDMDICSSCCADQPERRTNGPVHGGPGVLVQGP